MSMAKMDISIVRRLALRLAQASTLGEWKISERNVQFQLLSLIRAEDKQAAASALSGASLQRVATYDREV